MADNPRFRGMILHSMLGYIEKKGGKESLENILAGFDGQTKEVLSHVVPKDWYSYDVLINLEEAIVKSVGKGDQNILVDAGKFVAEDNTKFFLKLFLKFAKPRDIVKRWPVIWKMYVDGGEYVITELSEKSVVSRVANFPSLKHTTCNVIVGWGRYSLEASGAKNVRIKETKCIEKGDDYTEWQTAWE